MIEKILANPKELFFVDGLGAILSAFLVGVVFVRFESAFGIPSSTLYILATLPLFFAIYDGYCFRKVNDEIGLALKGIAIINLLYCCISIGFAFYHFRTITGFGWAYISMEILIVVLLSVVELHVAKRLIQKS